jgi:hypothetical protein
MSHAVRFELRTRCPAADAGLTMPLTRSVMIFTGSPRFLRMVSTPSRLHLVSEPGRLSADPGEFGRASISERENLEAEGFPD